MDNPYDPPKVIQQPKARPDDFFERAQRYQWWAFYAGLVCCIFGVMLSSMIQHPMIADGLDLLGSVGAVLLFLSLGSILPLAIWGFVKGYRESGGEL